MKRGGAHRRFKQYMKAEKTLDAMLKHALKQHRKKVAYHFLGVSYTYGQLNQKSTALAYYLHHHCHLEQGDCVALMLPNCIQWPIAFLACVQLGLIITTINPLASSEVVASQLKHAQVKQLIVLDTCFETIAKADISCTVLVTTLGDELPWYKRWALQVYFYWTKVQPKSLLRPKHQWYEALGLCQNNRLVYKPKIVPKDPCLMLYTSGTTQQPKGVLLSHGNLVANLAQIKSVLWPRLNHGNPQALVALPLYHIFSLMANALLFLNIGGSGILIPDPRRTHVLIQAFQKYPITCLAGVNPLFHHMLGHKWTRPCHFASLRLTVSAAMALDADIARHWERVTGCPIIQAYGLSEASPGVCIQTPGSVVDGSSGPPLPGTQVTIRNKKGQILSQGTSGEICIQGPQVMQGYWHYAQANRQALGLGYLRTGDWGQMDSQGHIKVIDRIKDVMVVSGFNVVAAEVEAVFMQHAHVKQVAVIGQHEAVHGDKIVAFVVKSDDKKRLSAAHLMRLCQKKLQPYQVPKKIIFCDILPLTPLGKVKKAVLRQMLVQGDIKTIMRPCQRRKMS